MTVQEKEPTINSVIEIFLPLGKNKPSLSDELQEVVSREAAEVAVRQVGGAVETARVNYAAARAIVTKVGSRAVADFAVSRCMEIYDANKNQFFSLDSNAALNAAISMLPYASPDLKERVIAAVAENGWYGRIESLANKYLNRGLTIEEVLALVNSYVNNKGVRAEHTEKELLRIARAYAPGKTAEVGSKIRQFVIDFERDDIY
ncbi:MAG: hypothetical protein A2831_01725 [Candidatus Yanofskybacteria bacterium RIFCSPHIGHO2_01_FULL_44_17]|uniref:Uncharacterized protein n=1 Tax=Candidatus Yanofskybacteria bacterium RIFCSPHIGHO2_01_FULL_44_17 TaxID=1802668 RepID=A0A1F8EV38_9BACT|nr:MAG: hypothetical protein A2831_01725 [Candidatus Yanofskybacteria bacterium RIFCSPHIGHO2_01_FULL_44_17]